MYFSDIMYPMAISIIAAALVLLFILWNTNLLFFREKNKKKLVPDESKCFSPKCRSIRYDNSSDTAYFFIHGFPTTPNMYEYPTKRLSDLGYDVYAPLIPTFGADPKDFEDTEFSQWFEFLEKRYLEERRSHKHIHVVGVSMGGAMTLKLAETFSSTPDRMDSITVIAAPVVYNSFLKDHIVTDWRVYIARTIMLFKKSLGGRIVDGRPDQKDGNEEWRGYDGIFLRPSLSFIWNLKKIRKDLKKITVPLLSIHDRNDSTVPFANQRIITGEVSSSVLKIEEREMEDHGHSRHSLLMYNSSRVEVTEEILKFTKENTNA